MYDGNLIPRLVADYSNFHTASMETIGGGSAKVTLGSFPRNLVTKRYRMTLWKIFFKINNIFTKFAVN